MATERLDETSAQNTTRKIEPEISIPADHQTLDLLRTIDRGRMAKVVLLSLKGSRSWFFVKDKDRTGVLDVLSKSQSLTEPEDLPKKLPQLRVSTAIQQITEAIEAQKKLQKLSPRTVQEQKPAEVKTPQEPAPFKDPPVQTPVLPAAAPEIVTQMPPLQTETAVRTDHAKSAIQKQPPALSEISTAQLEVKSDEELFPFILQGRIARQVLVNLTKTAHWRKLGPAERTIGLSLIEESQRLRGYVVLPEKTPNTKPTTVAPVISRAIEANRILAQRLRQKADTILGNSNYQTTEGDLSDLIDQAIVQTLQNFRPEKNGSLQDSLDQYLIPLMSLVKTESGSNGKISMTLLTLLNNLGISRVFYREHSLGEGLKFETSGNVVIVDPDQQDIIRERLQQTFKELEQWRQWQEERIAREQRLEAAARANSWRAAQPRERKEKPSRFVPSERKSKPKTQKVTAPENYIRRSDFIKLLKTTSATFKKVSLEDAMEDLLVVRRSVYFSPQQQKQVKEFYAEEKGKRRTKAKIPKGHTRLAAFLKRKGVSAYVYHHHNLGEGIVQNRKGVSPLINRQQQRAISEKIRQYQKSKAEKSKRPKRKSRLLREIQRVSALIPELSTLEPERVSDSIKSKDPAVLNAVREATRYLTQPERDLVVLVLSGTLKKEIAAALKTEPQTARLIEEVALEGLKDKGRRTVKIKLPA